MSRSTKRPVPSATIDAFARALPTFKYVLDQGGSVIAMTHVGRPSGDPAKDALLKTDKIAMRLCELLGRTVRLAGNEVVGPGVTAAASALKPGEVLMLENLRFDKREQKNDADFAAQLGHWATSTSTMPSALVTTITMRPWSQCRARWLGNRTSLVFWWQKNSRSSMG